MLGRLSDKDIIEGIRLQEDEVLNYLYDKYYPTVRNYIIKNSGTKDDVSDIFQDTIITLYQKIIENDFTLTSDLKAYFFGISRNLWSAQLRQKMKTEQIDADFISDDVEETDDPLFQKIISRAFAILKPDCRKILTLFYEGAGYDEIAEKMSLKNEQYARRKKYLCKEALMEIIKQDPDYAEYLRFLK